MIQGPLGNQLIYKVGQGRGLKEQASRERVWEERPGGVKDEGMWVWAGKRRQ